jgi:hypothetical protein
MNGRKGEKQKINHNMKLKARERKREVRKENNNERRKGR